MAGSKLVSPRKSPEHGFSGRAQVVSVETARTQLQRRSGAALAPLGAHMGTSRAITQLERHAARLVWLARRRQHSQLASIGLRARSAESTPNVVHTASEQCTGCALWAPRAPAGEYVAELFGLLDSCVGNRAGAKDNSVQAGASWRFFVGGVRRFSHARGPCG